MSRASKPLWLQFRIPIEIIHPAFVQMVGWEEATVVVEFEHGGLERDLVGVHADLGAGLVGLAQIAGAAGCDHIFPSCLPAFGAGDQMVKGEIIFRAAILAGELIAQKDVEPSEGWIAGGFDVVLKRDHAWNFKLH